MAACGSGRSRVLALEIRVDNLYVSITRSGARPVEFPDTWPEELLPDLTKEILSRL